MCQLRMVLMGRTGLRSQNCAFLFAVPVFPQFSTSLADSLKGKARPEEMKLTA